MCIPIVSTEFEFSDLVPLVALLLTEARDVELGGTNDVLMGIVRLELEAIC